MSLRVSGASMAPSIWGMHASLQCSDCQIRWLANWQPAYRPQRDLRCWNCGSLVDITSVHVRPEDCVMIDPNAYLGTDPQQDEIVAINDSSGWRIKRVAACPGDVVDVDPSGRLQVNEKEYRSTAAWIDVHDDRYRSQDQSWWRSDHPQCQTVVDGFKIKATETDAAVLVYQHRSVYDRQQADVVRDDCIFNLNENRPLRPVEHLALQWHIECQTACELQVWFHGDELRYQSYQLPPGKHSLRASHNEAVVYDQTQNGLAQSPVQLDAFHPVVIRLVGQARLSGLLLQRPVQYWVDQTDQATISFPLTLSKDQYFMVGDNVPFSIDSRHSGPVQRDQIYGKVTKINHSE